MNVCASPICSLQRQQRHNSLCVTCPHNNLFYCKDCFATSHLAPYDKSLGSYLLNVMLTLLHVKLNVFLARIHSTPNLEKQWRWEQTPPRLSFLLLHSLNFLCATLLHLARDFPSWDTCSPWGTFAYLKGYI